MISSLTAETSKKKASFIRLLKPGESVTKYTDANGEINFENLDLGEYQITEVKTLPGKTLLAEPITVTLPISMTTAEAGQHPNLNINAAIQDTGYTNKLYFFECTFDVKNSIIFRPPSTGGNGISKYLMFGCSIFALAGAMSVVLLIGKKKKKTKN